MGQLTSCGLGGVYEIPTLFWRCFRDGKIRISFLSDCIKMARVDHGLVIWDVFCLFSTCGNWPFARYLFFKVKSSLACLFL